MKTHTLILLCCVCSALTCILFESGAMLLRDNRVVWQYDKARWNVLEEKRRQAEEAKKRAAWYRKHHIKDGQCYVTTNAQHLVVIEWYGGGPIKMGDARTGFTNDSFEALFYGSAAGLLTNVRAAWNYSGSANMYLMTNVTNGIVWGSVYSSSEMSQPDTLPSFGKNSMEFGWKPDGTIVCRIAPECHGATTWEAFIQDIRKAQAWASTNFAKGSTTNAPKWALW